MKLRSQYTGGWVGVWVVWVTFTWLRKNANLRWIFNNVSRLLFYTSVAACGGDTFFGGLIRGQRIIAASTTGNRFFTMRHE